MNEPKEPPVPPTPVPVDESRPEVRHDGRDIEIEIPRQPPPEIPESPPADKPETE